MQLIPLTGTITTDITESLTYSQYDAAHTPHGDDNFEFVSLVLIGDDAAHTPHGDDNLFSVIPTASDTSDAAHTPHGDDNYFL